MSRFNARFLCLFVGVFLLAVPCSAAQNRALIVQVAQYHDPQMPELMNTNDTVLDAAQMTKVLTERWGFQCTALDGKRASRSAIMKALSKLSRSVTQDDNVVIYFSGLGGTGATDLAICPWDASHDASGNDITAAELRAWTSTVHAHSVTFMLDVGLSSIGPDRELSRDFNTGSFCPGGPRLKSKSLHRHTSSEDSAPADAFVIDGAVVLLAAQPHGDAYEVEVGVNSKGHAKWEGLFTYYLANQLKSAMPDTTFGGLMKLVDADIKAYVRLILDPSKFQIPAVFGTATLLDGPLFSGN